MVVIREYLFKLKQIWKDLTNSIQLPYGCFIFIKYWDFVLFSLELVTLWKSYYLIELSCDWQSFFMWLTKFLFIKMSTTNWYQMNFNFTALSLLLLIEIIIGVVNKSLSFIFTTGFGDEFFFLNSHCEDPFIVILNLSRSLKWFSKIFWSSDVLIWYKILEKGFMLFFIKYWSLESM